MIATCPDNVRYGKRTTGRNPRVGGFETSDLNLEWQTFSRFVASLLSGLDHDNIGGTDPRAVDWFNCDEAAMFMTRFFKDIPKERYTFLLEGSKGDSASAASPMSSPLEGSYPYGHTGRTVRDPLAAFWCYRVSQSGKRIAHLIKPGKHTPYVSDGEYVNSPYIDDRRKQVRQQNGRYRHLASHSMQELIAMGWDGAMYLSTKVKGSYVPFISGYDSDPDDRYDPIDVQAGKRMGIIGLPPNDVGLYMEIPGHGVVQLK